MESQYEDEELRREMARLQSDKGSLEQLVQQQAVSLSRNREEIWEKMRFYQGREDEFHAEMGQLRQALNVANETITQQAGRLKLLDGEIQDKINIYNEDKESWEAQNWELKIECDRSKKEAARLKQNLVKEKEKLLQKDKNLGVVAEGIQSLTLERKELKKECIKQRGTIKEQKTQLEEKHKTLCDAIKLYHGSQASGISLEFEITALKQKLEQKEKQIGQKEQQVVQAAEWKNKELKKLCAERCGLKRSMEELRAQCDYAQASNEGLEGEVRTLKETLNERNEEVERLCTKTDTLGETIRALAEANSRSQGSCTWVEGEWAKLNKELKIVRDERGGLRKDFQELSGRYDDLQVSYGLLGEEVDSLKLDLDAQMAACDKFHAECDGVSEHLNELSLRYADLQVSHNTLEAASKRYNALQKSHEKLEREVEQLNDALKVQKQENMKERKARWTLANDHLTATLTVGGQQKRLQEMEQEIQDKIAWYDGEMEKLGEEIAQAVAQKEKVEGHYEQRIKKLEEGHTEELEKLGIQVKKLTEDWGVETWD